MVHPLANRKTCCNDACRPDFHVDLERVSACPRHGAKRGTANPASGFGFLPRQIHSQHPPDGSWSYHCCSSDYLDLYPLPAILHPRHARRRREGITTHFTKNPFYKRNPNKRISHSFPPPLQFFAFQSFAFYNCTKSMEIRRYG